ncbi:amidase [Labrys wisconsinensis]|nr:amidase [Labrys wisconsinensis]
MEEIGELAAALRAGRITAEALVERSLGRIARLDGALNSFVALDEAGARAAARDSDRRLAAGAPRSPLEGIPLSVKDNLHAAGLPSSWGSRAFAGFRPEGDELPVARLRAAGAVILGKTNVPELTLEGYTRNDLFGTTRNPWNPDLTPGGSSGGAAAGVAAGLVPAALGTDGGGSIRRPACHTGLVGWKPSIGHLPRLDGFPAPLADFETVGTLTRSVGDAILLDAAMAGPDPRDRRSLLAAAPQPAGERLRIAYIPRFGTAPVDPVVAAAVEGFALALERDGHAVREQAVFFDLDDAARIWHVVSRAGVAWLMDRPGSRLPEEAGAAVQAMAADGRALAAADYCDALERTARLRRRCAELFATSDLVLTPTAAALPWPAETPYPREIAGRPAGPRDHAVFTGWVNIAGVPAVSLPVGLSATGLPIGAQLAAGFAADAWLLEFAREAERMRPAPPLPTVQAVS